VKSPYNAASKLFAPPKDRRLLSGLLEVLDRVAYQCIAGKTALEEAFKIVQNLHRLPFFVHRLFRPSSRLCPDGPPDIPPPFLLRRALLLVHVEDLIDEMTRVAKKFWNVGFLFPDGSGYIDEGAVAHSQRQEFERSEIGRGALDVTCLSLRTEPPNCRAAAGLPPG
jgi:hypothetical protein